jgi:hypothetical protein
MCGRTFLLELVLASPFPTTLTATRLIEPMRIGSHLILSI